MPVATLVREFTMQGSQLYFGLTFKTEYKVKRHEDHVIIANPFDGATFMPKGLAMNCSTTVCHFIR
jgi:hypothetical protein